MSMTEVAVISCDGVYCWLHALARFPRTISPRNRVASTNALVSCGMPMDCSRTLNVLIFWLFLALVAQGGRENDDEESGSNLAIDAEEHAEHLGKMDDMPSQRFVHSEKDDEESDSNLAIDAESNMCCYCHGSVFDYNIRRSKEYVKRKWWKKPKYGGCSFAGQTGSDYDDVFYCSRKNGRLQDVGEARCPAPGTKCPQTHSLYEVKSYLGAGLGS